MAKIRLIISTSVFVCLLSLDGRWKALNVIHDAFGSGSESGQIQASGGLLPQSLFDGTKPPAFNAASAMGVASVFTSCQGNITNPLLQMGMGLAASNMRGVGGTPGMRNALMNPMGAGMMGGMCPMATSGTIDMNTQCPGSSYPPDTSSLNCQMLMYNSMMMEAMSAQVSSAMCSLQCQKGKLQAVMGEVNCLTAQANALAQQIGSLNQVYSNNIQRMEKDVLTIQSLVDDRKAQYEDVTNKLQPEGNSGTTGLLKLQSLTQQLLSTMPVEIQKVRSQFQANIQNQNILNQRIQQKTMALTMDCFSKRTVDSYRCSPNGPPVSPKDYLLCRFQQNLNLGSNGIVEQNNTSKIQAEAQAGALSSLLEQIAGDASNQTELPTDQNKQQPQTQGGLQVLSVADIQNLYGSRLASYKIAGTDAQSFVMSIMKSCNQRATREIQLESDPNNASTDIGQAEFKINQDVQSNESNITNLFNQYAQQFSDDMSGLTGQLIPLDLSKCTNAPQQVQLNCLDQVRNTMTGLLLGTDPKAVMKIQIKGNNPQTFINFSCRGINGCVTGLQNVSRNLKVETNKLEAFKKAYVQNANHSTENFTKSIAQQLSGQSQMLAMRLQTLGTAMASLGSGGGLNLSPVKGEPFQYDEKTGLIKQPTNLLSMIGQYVNPPLPDLSGNGLTSAMSGLSSTQQRLDQQYAQLSQSMTVMQSLSSTCHMMMHQGELQGLNTLADHMQNVNCHNHPLCQENATQTINNLNTALNKIRQSPAAMGGGMMGTMNPSQMMGSGGMMNMMGMGYGMGGYGMSGMGGPNFSALQTGIENFCAPSGAAGQQDDKQVPSSACASIYSQIMDTSKNLSMGMGAGSRMMGAGSMR